MINLSEEIVAPGSSYRLDEGERETVSRIAEDLHDSHRPWRPMAAVAEVSDAAAELPLGVRRFLAGARRHEKSVFRIGGLPVGPDLEPTPPGWRAAAAAEAATREEIILMLFAETVGDTYSWRNQQDGRLVHDICPDARQTHSMTSASSRAELGLHTEDAFHGSRADYIALFCLRNSDRVATTVAHLDSADLAQDTVAALRRTDFRFEADDSHEPSSHDALEETRHESGAVLFGPVEAPYVRLDIDFTTATEPAASAALQSCAAALRDRVRRLVLEEGDLVFVDNYQVVHGREPFTPRFDGTDRWLKRCNLLRDLRRARVSTGAPSRILE